MDKSPGLRPFVLLAGLALFAGGCQDKAGSQAQKGSQTPAEAVPGPQGPGDTRPSTAPPATEMHAPRFKVDGKKLAAIDVGQDIQLLSIKALPPIEEWKLLIVHSIEGREFRAVKPALLTGQRTMKIVKRDDASYEFLVMQLEGASESIRHRMPRIKVVEIQTHSYAPPVQQPQTAALVLKIKGETRKIGPAELQAIQRTPEPGSEKNRDTWLLLDVFGGDAIAADQSVILRAHANEDLTLTSAQLADKQHQHMIKKNRRGQFHYRKWRLGDPPEQTTELRSLVEIELP